MTVGHKKEGSGAAFWMIILFLAIAIAFAVWFWLKREEKPAKASPKQSRVLLPIEQTHGRLNRSVGV